MIIIKTKNGDRFINDKAVTMVEHDRGKAVVNVNGDKGVFFHIENVESIIYANDAQPTSWQDEGSALGKARKENGAQRDTIKRLQKEKKAVLDDLHHFAYDMELLVGKYHAALPNDVRRQILDPALRLKAKVLDNGYDTSH